LTKTLKIVGSIFITGIIFTGCGTMELQTQSKLTKTIVLDHSKLEQKNIYLQVTNTAGGGGENMDLYNDIKNRLAKKGYNVIANSKNAEYGLFVNVLFANNLKEANALKAATGLGVVGAAGSYASGGSGGDALVAGLVVALGAGIVGKALEDEIFRAVIDVEIRDYTTKDVKTLKGTSISDASIANVQRSGTLNQVAGPIGSSDGAGTMNSGISESTIQESVKDHEKYNTRVFAEAVKMKLQLNEAMPILQDKVSTQIVNLF